MFVASLHEKECKEVHQSEKASNTENNGHVLLFDCCTLLYLLSIKESPSPSSLLIFSYLSPSPSLSEFILCIKFWPLTDGLQSNIVFIHIYYIK